MFNKKSLVYTALAATMVGGVMPGCASANEFSLIGANRFDTANKIASAYFSNKAPVESLILVNSSAIADALSVAPYACKLDAPVLLVNKDNIPASTAAVIKKLAPKKVVLIGGENSISSALEAQIKSTKVEVERLQGSNRVATSMEIARKMGKVDEAIVVNGFKGIPDAASAGAIAARLGIPMVLSNDSVSSYKSNMESLGIKKAYLVGGTSSLVADFDGVLAGKRIAGANRRDTNFKLVKEFCPSLVNVYIAKDGQGNSSQLIDSVTIGGLAGTMKMPILLGNVKSGLDANQLDLLKSNNVKIAIGVGGGNLVSGKQIREVLPQAEIYIDGVAKPEKVDDETSTGGGSTSGGGGGGSSVSDKSEKDLVYDVIKKAAKQFMGEYGTVDIQKAENKVDVKINTKSYAVPAYDLLKSHIDVLAEMADVKGVDSVNLHLDVAGKSVDFNDFTLLNEDGTKKSASELQADFDALVKEKGLDVYVAIANLGNIVGSEFSITTNNNTVCNFYFN